MGKTVPQSKFTEWKGLDRIQVIVHDMRCIWREISKDDFGIDGEIEVVVPKPDGEGFHTLGNIIKVQAKSGGSYVVQDSDGSFATPVERADLEMWSTSHYPVLFVVYHPKDDKLYCKEIRGYVRNTMNVFQPPHRVVFSKHADEFNVDYFDAVKEHANVSQPRISFNEREQLFSNLLTVRRLPPLTHASTQYTNFADIRDELRDFPPPFCIVGDRLFTVDDLRSQTCPLTRFCDGDIERLTPQEWIEADPERQRDYVFLLNQILARLRWQIGLKYSRDYDRTYFPRENGTDKEFKRDWKSVRTGQTVPGRTVAKYYEYGLDRFWRHLACNLSFLNLGGRWFLRIVPKYFFTTDGETPCEAELAGPYTTRLKAMEHNMQVLNHVLFWADVLARGDDSSISYHLGGRMILNIDKTPVTGIADFAIPDDPATFEEKAPSKQLELFTFTQQGDEDD